MKTVLVTGATGFVGLPLTSHLHESCEVNVLLRKDKEGPWDKVFLCDFQEGNIPEDAFKNVDTVFHLAGVAHDVRADIEDIYWKVNTESTVKLAKIAIKNKVQNFVFVSSVKAGGSPDAGVCVDESSTDEPDGVYGKTKREAEIQLLELAKASAMNISILRPSLVYGVNVKGNLKMMLKGISKGWFPPLPETFNRRSMVHVDDLIKAILLVSQKDAANGEIFIVTDGEPYSSREIFDAMCIAMNRTVPAWSVPKVFFYILAKLGDVVGHFIYFPFDSYKIKKLLGDDCYKSDKIRNKLGFKSSITLRDALPEIIKKSSF